MGTVADPVARLRAACLRLPGTSERNSHGEPGFFVGTTVKSGRQFLAVDRHHHGADHIGFWCPAPPGAQEALIAIDPGRFFRPPYVGHRGWVGVRLQADGLAEPDWSEIDEIVREAYRCVAPAKLAAGLDP